MKLSDTLKTIPVAALLALALMPAARAGASASQVTIMQDDNQIVFTTDAHRAAILDEMKSLGADVVKIRVDWHSLSPKANSKHKPSGFSGDDPNEYRAVVWGAYDRTIRAIVGRGMRPYLQLGERAPRWASGSSPVVRPKSSDFRRFVQAVGTRYSGTFVPSPPDPLGTPPPQVTLFSVWTEPNLFSWLSPQYAHGRPTSPKIYRQLVRAADDGLAASGHGSDELLIGELLPFARSGEAGSRKVRPIEFLRELACVDGQYHPYKGKVAKARGCSNFKPIPGTGLAYHPYTLPGGPDVATPNKDDASITELSRVVRALDKLSNRHRLESSRMPIWISEFGFQTNPPDRYQTPIKKVPGFLGQSEWLAYRNPRVVSYSQYPLIDDPIKGGGGFQSGLRKHDGKKKSQVYKAFQLPLFVERRSDKVVEVFGGVRAGAEGDKVTIESRLPKGKYKKVSGGTVQLGSEGYFDRVFTLSNAAKRVYRFRFSGHKSRAAAVHR
jgi:hypothetical protein